MSPSGGPPSTGMPKARVESRFIFCELVSTSREAANDAVPALAGRGCAVMGGALVGRWE